MVFDVGSMIIGGVITLTGGTFIIYVLSELAALRRKVNAFPTPEQLAKEIVKIKIPLSELPEDVANELMRMKGNPAYNPAEKMPNPSQHKTTYIG